MGAKKINPKDHIQISDLFSSYWSFFSEASRNTDSFCRELSTTEFIKYVSMRGLRSRGVDIEKRIAFKNGWSFSSKNREAGDLVDDSGQSVEVKSSIVTPNLNSTVTLRGFRRWENKVDYYLVVILDVSLFHSEPMYHLFKLPKSYILNEPMLKPYSQSRKSLDGNRNIPLGINFKVGDEIFLRWKADFQVHHIGF